MQKGFKLTIKYSMRKTIIIAAISLFILAGCFQATENHNKTPSAKPPTDNVKIDDAKVVLSPKKKNANKIPLARTEAIPSELLCNVDSDCISATNTGSCYYSCGKFDQCNSAPKCGILNKTSARWAPLCEIGHPCKEPKNIKCIENKCTGEW